MTRFAPIPPAAASEKVRQTYGRLDETFGEGNWPEPFLQYAHVPAFLQDFFMNFKKFYLSDGKLDAKLKTLIGFVVAGQAECRPWQNWFADRAKSLGLEGQTLADAAAVAATCSMYNVFFKFRDIAGTEIFQGMSVGLRAHAFQGTSLDERTVELINVVVSDLSGCKPCTSGHVTKAQTLGISDDAILEAIQCAATLTAGVAFLKSAG